MHDVIKKVAQFNDSRAVTKAIAAPSRDENDAWKFRFAQAEDFKTNENSRRSAY